ncbi:MAG: heme ABC transporter ATP-binding protein [Oscillospiraceae bacterium]|nr:MAG: heme ABC transporter ATP-binding protein [Oscillospiraceae bacterium]
MATPVIEFKNFTLRYTSQKKPTLHDINLTICQGEKVLILGPSGSGKSTLGNCLNGLLPFSTKAEFTGSVKVAGLETREQSIHKLSAHVGTVMQDSDCQFAGLTVGEDVAFSLENDRVPRPIMLQKVKQALGIVDMTAFEQHVPFALSGGQKQKAALAGVLHNDVDILLFDEPLAALDPMAGLQAIELIDRIHKEQGKTIVIIEHRLEDVLHRPVDRVILMDRGRIVADTTPAQLLCGSLLQDNGIREPLYLTALKYAGCTVSPQDEPDSISSIRLEGKLDHLRAWFAQPVPPPVRQTGPCVAELQHVSFSYDKKPVLKDVSFQLFQGERVALVGKNGAGKSTIAHMLMGIRRPKDGSVLVEGKDYASLSIKEIGERIGYVMQNPNHMLIKDMIREEVTLALTLRGASKEEIDGKFEQVMELCGLSGMKNWPVSALSYGQKKRVTIASLLVTQPKVMILDEPTAGQDFRHYREIMEFLDELNRKMGLTVVFITHDMHLAIEYTDRVIVMADGEKIADGDVFRVLSNEAVLQRAHLKETSLCALARRAGLPPEAFVRHFIHYERMVRAGEQ